MLEIKEPVMPTILVGVDASERSSDAIAFAHRVASASGATIVVANVFPYDPGRMAKPELCRALEREAVALVDRMSDGLGDLGEGRVRTLVAARISPAHGLQELADREHADLIVVGSSHVGTAGRVMPGSTGERLLHGASCAVAIVPQGYRTTAAELHRIGVAYNGTRESVAALRSAVDIARAAGGELRVIRVMEMLDYGMPALMSGPGYVRFRKDVEHDFREELDEAMRGLPADIHAQSAAYAGEPEEQLPRESRTLDVLVTGSRGYGPLHAVIVGGVSGRLVRDAACPVVVVPRGVDHPLGELFARRAEVRA
jgi:nucleotide-binding universal stress UspA family protein